MPRHRKDREGHVSKKVSRACERCRTMKVKCSGIKPCTRCARSDERCHFSAEDLRVSVPESYLRFLERRYEADQRQDQRLPQPQTPFSPAPRSDIPGDEPMLSHNFPSLEPDLDGNADLFELGRRYRQPHLPASGFSQNPLVDRDYTFRIGPRGRHLYMGPSSSWTFCRRVLALVGQYEPDVGTSPDSWNSDGFAFRLEWKHLGAKEKPDLSDLPPLDHSLYLFNAVKYHLGVVARIIDEEAFLHRLYQFYANPEVTDGESLFWLAQFLLVLAFGKAFVDRASSHPSPPGAQYASRAMALMPDLSGMHDAPFMAIETLCLGALYLQSIDMRVAAFQHIGGALRLCIIEGIHRHMSEDVVGKSLSQRANTIFWIVYILDRNFSALIGAPSSIRDEDITTKYPAERSDTFEAFCLTLDIRLSCLTAQILTTVYGVGKDVNNSLIKNTQSLLRTLAELSGELTDILNTRFQDSIRKQSRTATRLILQYHYCVVLTTRPLVMCALQMQMKQEGSATLSLSDPVSSLLQSCVESALTVLRTLRALGDDGLLDSFLPFQVEDAFASGFLLHIIHTVVPGLIRDDSWSSNVHAILDQMISNGSVAAPLRKHELTQLERMVQAMSPAATRASNVPPGRPRLDSVPPVTDDAIDPLVDDPSWGLFLSGTTIGLSEQELMDLAGQLDAPSAQ